MNQAHRTLILFVCCLLLAGVAFAFEGMSATFDSASWDIDKAHGSILTVKGPSGIHVRKAFEAGETPTFTIWDKAGNALPDGQYNWQLSLAAAERVRGEDAPGQSAESFSGTFRIVAGSLLVPKASNIDSDSPNKDQVILDDLIVDGSLCVGFDCVNGENFGFDTIRLKENNTRIKFDDTSNSGSFPFVDWQLTANDSANGGANKFSIDDITNSRTPFTIEASAPSNSLFVDDGGRIGLGTSTPVVELHVVNGDSPTLRLEQNGSSGFNPQTWDVAGNETNFFVRDVTSGSRLPFKIIPGATTNSLVIGSSGNVGIGAGTSPSAPLHVRRADSTAQVMVEDTGSSAIDGLYILNAGPARFALENTVAGDVWRFNYASSGELRIGDSDANVEFQVDGDGNATFSGLAGNPNDSQVCVNASGRLCICGSC